MGYFCPKTTVLQLLQRIYLTLLSIICGKIHQIPYVLFEAISHYSRHNSSVIFGIRSQFFFKLCPLFIVMRHNSYVLFHLRLHTVWTKGAHHSAYFQTFDCSHENDHIPFVIFQATTQFSIKFCVTLQCHDT